MVQITAFTGLIPPNANAGAAANALRGSPVLLNGTASNDPGQSGLTLTYSWTVESTPSGSLLGDAKFFQAFGREQNHVRAECQSNRDAPPPKHRRE